MMDTQPWDYWTDGGRQAKGRANEIVAELERAMAKNPDHSGAIHLYIHTVEASDRPEWAEAGADRLATLMPGAGHIVHMPSHIYYRVGRYRDALAPTRQRLQRTRRILMRTNQAVLIRSLTIPTRHRQLDWLWSRHGPRRPVTRRLMPERPRR
jgi:hypothetical protein